jgi:ABC transport system ATP-binding/permease protein
VPLLELKNLSLAFGTQVILDKANLIINERERIGFVGRNGTGKTTLMKMLAGSVIPDDGKIHGQSRINIALMPQEIPEYSGLDIATVITLGEPKAGPQLIAQLAGEEYEESSELWELSTRVKKLLSSFNLDGELSFEELSGGLKRRVLLARALATDPAILLLDEPTNHLDIGTIEWLEKMVLSLNLAVITISHDRAFIDSICDRIVELDRGTLSSWPGNYEQYLVAKAKALAEEESSNKAFDKRLSEEETWIRQGIKARRTRNEGRVRALKRMRNERQQRKELSGKANFSANEVLSSGKLVWEANELSFSWSKDVVNIAEIENECVFQSFSTLIMRGDKIGIIGPNGCGKSTLIKLILGQLTPSSGSMRSGTRLDIATLDQHRTDIDDNKSVLDNVSGGRDQITINGKDKHIVSYMQDFLFTPERSRGPAGVLSGGERNRLMLAKLFSKPANLIILDEPTNDLDTDTLELLEQLLVDYSGTLLLVSHDRTFLNNVVSSTLAFDEPRTINEYVGGYDDWLRQKPQTKKSKPGRSNGPGISNTASKPKKLSYKVQRELDQLPVLIDDTEKAIEALQTSMLAPEYFRQEQNVVASNKLQLKTLEDKLAEYYARWESLGG